MKRRSFIKGIGALFALAAIPAIAVVDKVKPLVDKVKQSPLFNTVFVNSVDDLPEPIDGIISLEPNTDYKLTGDILIDSPLSFGKNTRLTTNFIPFKRINHVPTSYTS